ncbi:hypothetical protein [Oceanimonas baumannii]|uniref:Uncharacterized protein n=1 Tax=Oceanimonas baumannii TaxID=129578 RepID=A0A235CL93_9GAMM|nr:hypothetical protein [Oceanimonas baumannii]OYD25206.1 hypothetical protein B6S09_05870 [Oceanimonas baumannii]TDW62502.1 hypothetical protein LY04_00574 [Oceanimonas baumannii]
MAKHRKDPFGALLSALTAGGWTLYALLLILFHYGRPEQQYGYMRYLEVEVRTGWLTLPALWFHLGVWGALGLAVTTLTLVHLKGRRQSQYLKTYLAMLAATAVLTLLLFYFYPV